MKWKVLRKVYHDGVFRHPGEVIETDEKFNGAPNMEPVKDEPVPEIEVNDEPKDSKGAE